MNKVLLVTFILFTHLCIAQKTFHTICLIDGRTATHSIDSLAIKEMSAQLSKLLGLKPNDVVYDNKPLIDKGKINDELDKINKTDILLFYFSGEDKNVKIIEKSGKLDNIFINEIDLKNRINDRKPRVAIVLIEASTKEALGREEKFNNAHAGVITASNAKLLFNINQKDSDNGTLILLSATKPPKQPIYRNPMIGSYFLKSFKNNLYAEIGSDSTPSWDNIKEKTINEITNFTKNLQNPKGEIYPIK